MSARPRRATAEIAGAASVFAALGDETRLRLVTRLCADGPLSIVDLSAGVPVTRQAVTKHLHALADARLVRSRRRPGRRQRLWALESTRLAEARQYLDRISEEWDGALARLKAFVEE
jgi:DNA-binding transcriptional ArsR family regulator